MVIDIFKRGAADSENKNIQNAQNKKHSHATAELIYKHNAKWYLRWKNSIKNQASIIIVLFHLLKKVVFRTKFFKLLVLWLPLYLWNNFILALRYWLVTYRGRIVSEFVYKSLAFDRQASQDRFFLQTQRSGIYI